ncbi:MAG: alkaline phosphatase family protein [Polyangiaceae bacterium]|nr:alkaline phosphatase family protein [Polyangiaceae bacterium]
MEASSPRKVLLVEINEITWTILEPLLKAGKLPTFQRMMNEGVKAAPVAIERPPHLDPWISWVTLHTGVDRAVHGAAVLGQDEVHAKRTWEYAVEAGKTIGIFGSIGSYPPKPVPGFIVPGPFSPTSDTYPKYLSPALALNRRYTQVHLKTEDEGGLVEMAKQARDLLELGLTPATGMKIAEQLAHEKLQPHVRWKRVGLQPQINFDFFKTLYGRYEPDFATWHTGHCAHYMHHYWRAWDDSQFKVKATDEEKRHFGDAVPYGYELADQLLGRFLDMVDDRTVVMVASGLGMQPYVVDMYPAGKIGVRMKNVHRILDIFGAKGVGEVVPAMMPQWNIRIKDAVERTRVKGLFEKARVTGGPRVEAFHVTETGEILTVTPYGMASLDGEVRYTFPDAPHAAASGYPLEELFATDVPTPKEAMHHPESVMLMWGKDLRAGVNLPETSTLDIAPTILKLMGIPVPSIMQGRALEEAWTAPKTSVSVPGPETSVTTSAHP